LIVFFGLSVKTSPVGTGLLEQRAPRCPTWATRRRAEAQFWAAADALLTVTLPRRQI
jgi:hypothetical protein